MSKVKIEIKTLGGSVLFEYSTEGNTKKKTLIKAVKSGADLRGAYLTGADLTGADLRGAYLTGADLTGADLRGAYLRGAYLTGADLRGAYLTGADGEKIEVETFAVFAGLYKYVCIPFISKDGKKYVKMGCYTRTVTDWNKDFWNNENEFPKGDSEDSLLRKMAYDAAIKWLKIQSKKS